MDSANWLRSSMASIAIEIRMPTAMDQEPTLDRRARRFHSGIQKKPRAGREDPDLELEFKPQIAGEKRRRRNRERERLKKGCGGTKDLRPWGGETRKSGLGREAEGTGRG
ncbi:hypothetical protein GW17_00009349, partial [Ensete ventricosum]